MTKPPQDTPLEASPLRPQFNLKALLALTAVVSGWFACWIWFGVPAAVGFTLLTLGIFAHVAGNSMGMRLREHGSRNNQPHAHEVVATREKLDESAFAPATALREKQGLGSVILIATAIGIALGALVGAVVFLTVYWEYASFANISAGVLAFGTLGGMATFAGMSFLQVLCGAVSQASQPQPVALPRSSPPSGEASPSDSRGEA